MGARRHLLQRCPRGGRCRQRRALLSNCPCGCRGRVTACCGRCYRQAPPQESKPCVVLGSPCLCVVPILIGVPTTHRIKRVHAFAAFSVALVALVFPTAGFTVALVFPPRPFQSWIGRGAIRLKMRNAFTTAALPLVSHVQYFRAATCVGAFSLASVASPGGSCSLSFGSSSS